MDLKKKQPLKRLGKKQLKSYAVLDGMSVTDMTKEQLESYVYQLQQEVEKEKEERNYFQIERDRIQLFWEVSKHQLEEKDALLHLKDSELDEAALTHLAEIKLYKQKMKHVMFECQQHISEKMKEKLGEKVIAEEEHQLQVKNLESEIDKLKDENFQLKIAHEDTILNQRLKHGEELSALHGQYQKEMDIVKNKEVVEIGNIRQELELQKRQAIQETENEKGTHVDHLTKTHEELIQKMKNFYNDIIKNNILLITSLKNQLSYSQRREHFVKKEVKELKMKNESMKEELLESQQKLEKSLGNLDENANKHNLGTGAIIRNLKREVNKLKAESDILFTKLSKVENEKKQLLQILNSAAKDAKANDMTKSSIFADEIGVKQNIDVKIEIKQM